MNIRIEKLSTARGYLATSVSNSTLTRAQEDAKDTDLLTAKCVLIQQKIVSEKLISADRLPLFEGGGRIGQQVYRSPDAAVVDCECRCFGVYG